MWCRAPAGRPSTASNRHRRRSRCGRHGRDGGGSPGSSSASGAALPATTGAVAETVGVVTVVAEAAGSTVAGVRHPGHETDVWVARVGVGTTVSASSSPSPTKVRTATTHNAPSTTATRPTRNRRGPLGAARSGLIGRAWPWTRSLRGGTATAGGSHRSTGSAIGATHRPAATSELGAISSSGVDDASTPAGCAGPATSGTTNSCGHRLGQHRELDQLLGTGSGNTENSTNSSGTGSGNTENSTNSSGAGPRNSEGATNSCGIGSGNTENSTNSSGAGPRQQRRRRQLLWAPARATPRAPPTRRPRVPVTPRTARSMSEADAVSRERSARGALTVRGRRPGVGGSGRIRRWRQACAGRRERSNPVAGRLRSRPRHARDRTCGGRARSGNGRRQARSNTSMTTVSTSV